MTTTPRPDTLCRRHRNFVNHDDAMASAARAGAAATENLVIVFEGITGVGKSATAREFAFRVKDRYPDGVLTADLDGTLDQPGAEAEVLKEFLTELGVAPGGLPDRVSALQTRFQRLTAGKRFLVLLDGAVRPAQVRSLLSGDGRSLVLVASGEPMAALAVDTSVLPIELSPLVDAAATDLLGRLIGAGRTAEEPDAVAELITLCGGLPVALCVAASLLTGVRARTVAGTVERLRDERRRITALSPPGDLSVSAVFSAAYDQLGEPARHCYRALGASPRLTRVSADALAAMLDRPEHDVAEGLAELGARRLVEELGHDRYAVAELVALHAAFVDDREHQGESSRDRTTRLAGMTDRLRRFYHQRCYDADVLLAPDRPWRSTMEPGMRFLGSFTDRAAAVAWLDRERATITMLVEHAAADGDLGRASSWPVLLWSFHEAGKHVADLLATHASGLAAADDLRDDARTSLLHTEAGFGHIWLWQLDDAVRSFTAGAAAAQRAGLARLEATAVEGLGLAQLEQQENLVDARATLRRNLGMAERIDEPRRVALARLHLAKAEDPQTGLTLLAAADAFFAQRGDTVNRAKCARWTAVHLISLRRPGEAVAIVNPVVEVMSGLGRRFDQAEALLTLGTAQRDLGRVDEARRSWDEALTVYEDLGAEHRAAVVRDLVGGL